MVILVFEGIIAVTSALWHM